MEFLTSVLVMCMFTTVTEGGWQTWGQWQQSAPGVRARIRTKDSQDQCPHKYQGNKSNSLSTPEILSRPVLDLDVTAVNNQIYNPRFVAAPPEAEAAVVNGWSQIVKINKTGHTIKELYNCNSCHNIGSLLSLASNLYVPHNNGTTVELKPHTGQLLNVYNIPDVRYIYHYGSLSGLIPLTSQTLTFFSYLIIVSMKCSLII